MRVTDSIWFTGTRSDFALSTVAAQSAQLKAGVYDVWTDVDTFIKADIVGDNVTIGNGYLLRANNTISVEVGESFRIGAVVAVGTGTLSIHRVG